MGGEEKLNRSFYDRFGALILALLAVALMCATLFLPGGAGLSDNGDFARILRTNSLEYDEAKVSFVYQDTFKMVFRGETKAEKLTNLLFSTEGVREYPSIHLLFVRASLLGNLALNVLTGSELTVYRVQVLGAIYALIYAALLFLLFRSFRLKSAAADILVKLCCIAVLCDAGYTAYFNSLYSEPVQVVALLGAAVFALRVFTGRGRPLANALWLTVFCVLYGWAKFINIPVGMLAILFFTLAALPGLPSRGARAAAVCAGLVGVGTLAGAYMLLPKWMDTETNYNSVFYGVLKGADEAEAKRYLTELGLPEELSKYAGTNYYMTDPEYADIRGDAEFIEDFRAVGKMDLLKFYLKHPGRWIEEQSVAVGHSAMLRPFYLSNADGQSPRLTFTGRMSGWSELRVRLPFDGWALSLLLPALALFLLWRALRQRGKSVSGTILILLSVLCAGGYQFLSPILTNGEDDLAKHMFAFAQLMDLCLLFVLARFGAALCEKRRGGAAVLAGSLCVVILLGFFWRDASLMLRENKKHAAPEAGAVVSFGQYGGEALKWTVVSQRDGALTLLLRSPLAELPFDDGAGYGDNLWTDSSLREWLNGEFLKSFTAAERAMLVPKLHRVALSEEDAALSQDGKWGLFCFHAARYSARDLPDALAVYVRDTVYLPDIALASSLAGRGGLGTRGALWLDTPYYFSGSMVRYVAEDGYIYLRDASEDCGVCPMLTVRAGSFTGSGTALDPFVLT